MLNYQRVFCFVLFGSFFSPMFWWIFRFFWGDSLVWGWVGGLDALSSRVLAIPKNQYNPQGNRWMRFAPKIAIWEVSTGSVIKHQAHQTPHNSSRSHPVCMRNVKWILWPYSTILIITHKAMLILDNSKMAGQLWFTRRSGMNQASLKPVSALWVKVNSHLGLVHFSSPTLANRAIETGLQLV